MIVGRRCLGLVSLSAYSVMPRSPRLSALCTAGTHVFKALCALGTKLHVDVFDENFPGETAEGAAQLVAKVRSALNVRFQAAPSQPGIVFTDRGRGFYAPNSGVITPQYKQALADNDLRAFMGDNAVMQPGSMQDFLLHETAVSWLRKRLAESTPRYCWTETRPQYGQRLKRCCEEVNKDLDVEGLSNGTNKRLKKLHDSGGGRLRY